MQQLLLEIRGIYSIHYIGVFPALYRADILSKMVTAAAAVPAVCDERTFSIQVFVCLVVEKHLSVEGGQEGDARLERLLTQGGTGGAGWRV